MLDKMHIKPNTYHKAFLLGAIVAALISGLSIEIHDRDIFNLYKKPEHSNTDTLYNVSITIFITGIISYIAYWLSRFIFGYGQSSLVK